MKIGVVSDTHDWLAGMQKAAEIFKNEKVDLIVHCGDWVSPFAVEFFMQLIDTPVKSVFGNNLGDVKRIISENNKRENPIDLSNQETLSFDLENRKCIIYHGQDHTILDTLISSQNYDVVFTGHRHAKRNEVVGKTLILNPGTTCFACEGKIIKEGSVAIYNSETNNAEFITF